jgi:hypothetical protein
MGGEALLHRTVNKQAGWRRQEWWTLPSNLGAGKLVKEAVVRKTPVERGKGHSHMNCK